MVPDTGGRRIDRRLFHACLLALGVLVFVLAAQEVQHHRRIVRWWQVGLFPWTFRFWRTNTWIRSRAGGLSNPYV